MQFTHNSYANVNGTSFHARVVKVAPAQLIKLFGEPEDADEHKVSMAYTFEADNGEVVTLYDWQCTSLYNPCHMSPEELRAMTSPFEFHVGSRGGPEEAHFVAWLQAQCAAPEASQASKCAICKGTKQYLGFRGFPEPCRGCC